MGLYRLTKTLSTYYLNISKKKIKIPFVVSCPKLLYFQIKKLGPLGIKVSKIAIEKTCLK